MTIARCLQRLHHFGERVVREAKRFGKVRKNYGWKVAYYGAIDGIIPPGKSERYIHTVEQYVDHEMEPLVDTYNRTDSVPEDNVNQEQANSEKIPIWCCWWQGEEEMPEIVRMCQTRLKQVIPEEKAVFHLITLENYKYYVNIPVHIIEKFEKGIITMATMSDVLRFQLLSQHGGYWLDATVFFTGNIPQEYFTEPFFCQRMAADAEKVKREACKGNWCGFSIKGIAGNIIFRYMNDAFSQWWEKHDDIIDYVLIDYLLWTGYRKIPAISSIINSVPDNNEDIFELYQVLNQPYSEELYQKMIKRNVMHKLTYKMVLCKQTNDGKQTMYGWLLDRVYEGGSSL